MKLNLKYTASKVDEIEQERKLPIEECIQDSSMGNLTLFIRKGLVDESGVAGVSKQKALDIIDQYLAEDTKLNLVFDIMEALVNGGFLMEKFNVAELRAKVAEQQEKSISDKIGEL